ncbi:hypothetical protein OESDEN_02964 [Oesophagostomum dentatum]|uniref:Uncharacterized protein n=1 Tax=Oesophagostomum dentatum TaxID=61180 RepID=A0A0B1TML8_OESDE|nr:hypothetical protein OESDEN_02964 [Oesophagostomum dentatum]
MHSYHKGTTIVIEMLLEKAYFRRSFPGKRKLQNLAAFLPRQLAKTWCKAASYVSITAAPAIVS